MQKEETELRIEPRTSRCGSFVCSQLCSEK